jgi:type I restriction enzyme R subunit
MVLDDVRAHGVGKRYLIQHSAGSGKSNSIAWLGHQLIGLTRDERTIFDTPQRRSPSCLRVFA